MSKLSIIYVCLSFLLFLINFDIFKKGKCLCISSRWQFIVIKFERKKSIENILFGKKHAYVFFIINSFHLWCLPSGVSVYVRSKRNHRVTKKRFLDWHVAYCLEVNDERKLILLSFFPLMTKKVSLAIFSGYE